tara:strand:- start:98 stop:610 length:513 start_codon:yes stop_codon:yes gene_type:complete
VTVTEAVALTEPDVAVIVALPAATEVTTPDETVATEALDVVHVTVASLIVAPFWSLTVAMSVDVAPSDVNVRLVADSVIEAAVWVTDTVTDAVALTEPDVAVTVAVPAPTAVTRPDAETVATAVFEDDQVTSACITTVPPKSFTVGDSVVVSPIELKFKVLGDSVRPDST